MSAGQGLPRSQPPRQHSEQTEPMRNQKKRTKKTSSCNCNPLGKPDLPFFLLFWVLPKDCEKRSQKMLLPSSPLHSPIFRLLYISAAKLSQIRLERYVFSSLSRNANGCHFLYLGSSLLRREPAPIYSRPNETSLPIMGMFCVCTVS